jgi:heme oxygenase
MKTPEEIVKDYTTYLGGLSVVYEDKVVEMMYEYAQKDSAQVRENLSYYIKLADDFQKERDMWRENFMKQSDAIDGLQEELGKEKIHAQNWEDAHAALEERLKETIRLQDEDMITTLRLRDAEIYDLKAKLLANANGWTYAVEQSTYWKSKYESLKQETENVADFFAKYERRVI